MLGQWGLFQRHQGLTIQLARLWKFLKKIAILVRKVFCNFHKCDIIKVNTNQGQKNYEMDNLPLSANTTTTGGSLFVT